MDYANKLNWALTVKSDPESLDPWSMQLWKLSS